MKQIPHYAVYSITLFTALFIITISLLPHPPKILNPFTYSDKIFHALAYTAFTILVFISLKTRFSTFSGTAPLALFIVLILGGVIEIIQPYFSRSKDIYDFLSDTAGAAAGIFLTKQLIRTFHLSFNKKGVSFDRKHLP